jgi:cell division protein ZapA
LAQLTIFVNGKSYVVGCEDGQEARLTELAGMVDSQVKLVSRDVGQVGDTRLILMGALMTADELTEARARLAAAQSDLSRLRADLERAQSQAASALETAAERIEAIAVQ